MEEELSLMQVAIAVLLFTFQRICGRSFSERTSLGALMQMTPSLRSFRYLSYMEAIVTSNRGCLEFKQMLESYKT